MSIDSQVETQRIYRSLIEQNSGTDKIKNHLRALLNLEGNLQDRDKFNYREVVDYCQLLSNIYERVSSDLIANGITKLKVRAYWIEGIIDVFETEPVILDPVVHTFLQEYLRELTAPNIGNRDVETASLNCHLTIREKDIEVTSGSLELTTRKEVYLPKNFSLVAKSPSDNNPFCIELSELEEAIAEETNSQAERDELLDLIAQLLQLENHNRVKPNSVLGVKPERWKSCQRILKKLLRAKINYLQTCQIDTLTLTGELDSGSLDNLSILEIPEYQRNDSGIDLLSQFIEDLFDCESLDIDTGDAIFEMELELQENAIKVARCWVKSRVKQESEILAGMTVVLGE